MPACGSIPSAQIGDIMARTPRPLLIAASAALVTTALIGGALIPGCGGREVLRDAVAAIEGEHRPPVHPERRVEELTAHHLVDALALHLRALGEKDPEQVLLRPLRQAEAALL